MLAMEAITDSQVTETPAIVDNHMLAMEARMDRQEAIAL